MDFSWSDPGSWVSGAADLWNGLTGGSSSAADVGSSLADSAPTAVDGSSALAYSTPGLLSGASNYGSDILSGYGFDPQSLSLSGAATPSTSLLPGAYSLTGDASSLPSGAQAGSLADMVGSTAASTAPTSEPGLLSTATDWAKNNPKQLSNLVQLGAGLAKNYSPTAASQQQANLTNAANASQQDIAGQKTAVGQSLINTAPGLATNSLAASMGANATAQQHLQQQLNAQGYHAGDPQYDSQMAQFGTNANANNMTAYGQGAMNADQQMSTGAGLLTAYSPSTAGYNNLNTQQTGQQVGQNTQIADTANLGTAALNIYNNQPDPTTTTKADKAAQAQANT